MGCGKSSTGRELAELLGAGFTDLDELVVRREGRSIPEIFREGEAAFRKAELEALRELLGRDSDGPEVIALGGGTLTSEAARSLVFGRTDCVWLRTRLETVRARLGESDSTRPLFKDAGELFARREPVYALAPFAVDTDGIPPREVARRIARLLGLAEV